MRKVFLNKKAILSMALVLCLTFALAISAMAATIDDPSTKDDSNGTIVQNAAGNGEKEVLQQPNPQTDSGDVYALVETGKEQIYYYISIEWGVLAFSFEKSGRTWDPLTHTYTDGEDGKWDTTGFNDANNKISVTNHSNIAINAELEYVGDGSFDVPTDAADAVIGGFYNNLTEAAAAAAVTKNPMASTAIYNTLGTAGVPQKTNALRMFTAVGRVLNDASTVKSAYFAFSGQPGNTALGTPADAASSTPATYVKVGTITATVSANTTTTYNVPGNALPY